MLQGRIQGEAHPARAPPKIGKNMIFLRKIVIFHTKYPKNFRPSLAIGKNMIFWRKIVIFHTKYPNNFRSSLRSVQFFYVRPPNLKSWIRPCLLYLIYEQTFGIMYLKVWKQLMSYRDYIISLDSL